MSKGSGGTRTVNAANAAASRTYAQNTIGGNTELAKEMNLYKEVSFWAQQNEQKFKDGKITEKQYNDRKKEYERSLKDIQKNIEKLSKK